MHVMSTVPETLWDLEKEKAFEKKMKEHHLEWTQNAEKMAHQFLNDARGLLVEAGVPENDVSVILQKKKAGFARDIIEESKKAYEAVVVGRGGFSQQGDPFHGSISNKIVEKTHHIPVWVVGSDARAKSMLLAVDGSENSGKAVNHAGTIAAITEIEITLFHVVRKFRFLNDPTLSDHEIEGFWEEIKSDIPRMFRSYKARLEKAGVTASRISSKANLDRPSRSGDILKEAKEGGYGTIVMGRRGLSKVHDFLMGRVTYKVLNRAENLAVWIVP
jgi:nucleotide-binding universal stress UspA family protein